jgi:pyruvate dehydrogenase E2 component (dihydrolipoamide acetyltransferase)
MEVKLPELGDNVTQATVVGVLVKEGDRVEPGQPLLELETDKAVVEVPAEAGGVVKRVLVKVGDEVRPGQPFLELAEAEGGAEAPPLKAEERPEAPAPKAEEAPRPAPKEAPPAPQEAPSERRLIPAAPSIRRLARELGVDPGPEGAAKSYEAHFGGVWKRLGGGLKRLLTGR